MEDKKVEIEKKNPEEEEEDGVGGLFAKFINKKLYGSKKKFAEVE